MEPSRIKSRSIAFFVSTALLAMSASPVLASSHREAPFIAGQPKVDGTDFYMFRSYEDPSKDSVTFLADYIPLQDPQGGPNFNELDANALYEINIDNIGDGKEHLTYQFRFNNTSKATALNIGGKQVKIPLVNSSKISGDNPPSLNVAETYTVKLVTGGSRSKDSDFVKNAKTGSTTFTKPVDNIGEFTFGAGTAYETYAKQYIYDITIPKCSLPGRVFVGQRAEPFYLALGPTFDLLNFNPLGPETANTEGDIYNKNITTIALEVPTSCLTTASPVDGKIEPVIGAYTSASVRQGRLINPKPGSKLNTAAKEGGAWSQVSRLGMPLVNEVVIGLEDKDKFNSSKPKDDGQFADYVTNPVLPAVIQSRFGARAPTNFPRTDLIETFLNGINTLNQPKFVTDAKKKNAGFVAGEMLRLNTAIAPKALASQNQLGVLGGDVAGFPNGRRPADDVVDASIKVVMGVLCTVSGVNTAVGCKPTDAPDGGLNYNDGVRKPLSEFTGTFPYLLAPRPGSKL